MWTHRNEIEHGNETNNLLSQDRHETLNGDIDLIYTRIPALRLLPMTARHFFNKTKAWRKNRTIREKRNWTRDANIILKRFENIGDQSRAARNFENYFTQTGIEQRTNDTDD